jgi:hypothetical protein
VSLANFAKALSDFVGLMNGLVAEVAKDAKVRWIIDELEAGSATTTIRGEADTEEDEMARGEVIEAYEQVGLSLQSGRPVSFASVASYADDLVGMVNGEVTSIIFQTDDVDAEVISAPDRISLVAPPRVAVVDSFGAIRGRVQAMTNRRGYRFTLYELGSDRAVTCYYTSEQEAKVVAAYGHLVMVEGLIRRNPNTGLPTSIRDIRDPVVYPIMDRGGYRQARGAAPAIRNELTPEAAVRRVRDG